MVLQFVTIIEKGSFYVTGKAIVSGKKYDALANKFNPNSLLLKHG